MGKRMESLEALLERYLQEYEGEVTDEASANALIERFMAEHPEVIRQSMAPQKGGEKTARDDLNALSISAITVSDSDANEGLRELERAIAVGRRQMQAGRYFLINTGEFWLIPETRPFMRLLERRVRLLIECGRLRLAVSQGKEMLRLCERDSLGVRHTLRHLYAALEHEAALLELEERFPDEGTASLLPLAILRYKQGDEEEAGRLIRQIAELNPDLKAFVEAYISGDMPDDPPNRYTLDSKEQLLYMLAEYAFLYAPMTAFFSFADDVLTSQGA